MDKLAGRLRSALDGARDLQTVCDVTVDVLVDGGFALPSIYLRRGDRLRCHASRGYWQIVDGFLPGAGVMGRVYVSNRPFVIHDVSNEPDFIAAVPGILGEATVPVRCQGDTIGVLNVETMDVLPEDALERLGAVAVVVGERIGELGGLPDETLAERMADAVVALSALHEPAAMARATVAAAARLSGLECALIVRDLDDEPVLRASVGPSSLLARLDAQGIADLTALVRSGNSSYVAGDAEVRSSTRVPARGGGAQSNRPSAARSGRRGRAAAPVGPTGRHPALEDGAAARAARAAGGQRAADRRGAH